jgi:hypothetical protein
LGIWERRRRRRRRTDLEAVNGEKTTEDAFFETSAQNNHIILFIHDSDQNDIFPFGVLGLG